MIGLMVFWIFTSATITHNEMRNNEACKAEDYKPKVCERHKKMQRHEAK